MKRIYLFLALVMSVATASAQRNINLESKIIKPTASQTITVGTAFACEYTFTNKGTAAIMPGDTLFFVHPGTPTGQINYRVVATTKNTGDTLSFKTNLTVTGGTNGNIQFCIAAAVVKGGTNSVITDTDTSNNDDCKTVVLTGGSTGIANVTFTEGSVKENLTIVPNPASSDIKFDFVANSATEVKVRIIDITGREVYTQSFGKAYVGQTNYGLNVSQLNNGIYFVELAQDGRRAIGKVVKQ